MNTITKSIVALTLALSFLVAGAFVCTSTYVAGLNEGVMVAHDGPSHDTITY